LLAQPNQPDLLVLTDLIDAGQVTPVVDRCYPLHEVPEALRYLEKGSARGKVVITVTDDSDIRHALQPAARPHRLGVLP
jgi:D-arabinose 1-dehydrogenase-like Zn-dependent alcohol dehydrogenase